MTGWGKQYWGGGRASPVGGPLGHPPRVTDDDFSYITADDIPNYDSYAPPRPRAARDDEGPDLLFLRKGGSVHPLSFPAYSIDSNRLTVGTLRAEAARLLGVTDPGRLKLFYKGRILKDDYRTCLEEGLAMHSELMCVGADAFRDDGKAALPAGSDAGSESEDTSATGEGSTKKKRHRKKKKSRKSAGGAQSPPASSAHLAPPGSGAAGRSRSTSPVPPPAPKTAMEKLDAIASHFQSELLPPSIEFTARPPSDPSKRDFEHKRLTETILSQVVLKLDAVETEGDAAARQRRRDLVKDAQGVLNGLDAVVKKHDR